MIDEILNDTSVTLIAFYGFLAVFCYLLGSHSVQAAMWFVERSKRESIRKWGMETELFWSDSVIKFALMTAAVLAMAAFLFFMLPTEIQIVGNWMISSDDKSVIAMLALYLGLILKSQDFSRAREKLKKIGGLGDLYHERFEVSEILSMYEALHNAPPLFWEEYASLPDEEIHEQTNSAYRQRVAPYQFRQSRKRDQTIIYLTGLMFLLAILALIFDLNL